VRRIPRLALSLAFGVGCAAFAQTDQPSPTLGNHVALVDLLGAAYPPLARQARITGEVELKLEIRKDGRMESATVVSGPPMLTQAALNSAQQSRFACRDCQNALTTFSLVYSFQQAPSPGWPCPENAGPRITHIENRVTITTEPSLVDPYFVNVRARSAKCLYLWSCGSKWGGYDYYYYRVRSTKCLGLWNCGRRLREPFATCNKLHRQLAY
jgi:TonB family protein